MTAPDEKDALFPVMDSKIHRSVHWSFVAPHEKQALRNHGQTLKRLAERGGLCPSEMLAVIEGRPWRSMGDKEADDALTLALVAWTESGR